jgi:NAD(P)-dependent dehydrogenase (short-subunit alcohol dehydrogenase family)
MTASFGQDGLAVVIGASGGIGRAIADRLETEGRFARVVRLSRSGDPALDLTREQTIVDAAANIVATGLHLRLVFNAAGVLHEGDLTPEKSWRDIDPVHLQQSFAVNATGPMLLMKHLLPLLPADGKAVFATLSAKVGSIRDNELGGWYAYRASKAALNQFVRTAAIELKRRRLQAICVALHPGTVDTGLSSPFSKSGLDVQTPQTAAQALLATIEALTPEQSGGFFDRFGAPLPW